MTHTAADILRISQSKEKENSNAELKSFGKIIPLKDADRKDLACEIVAFANRRGGKIIFGVKDNGEPDEKMEIDVDTLKQTLQQICRDNISPVIECSIQVIDETGGFFVVMYIPKKKITPHAYIQKRSGANIIDRVYYIRTSHGKEPVSDGQLEYLFRNEGDPVYNHSFRIAFELDTGLDLTDGIAPMGNYVLAKFKHLLAAEDRKLLESDNVKFTLWLNELMPYMILSTLHEFFQKSWQLNLSDGFGRTQYGFVPVDNPEESETILISEIPREGMSLLDTLSWDFPGIIKDLFVTPIQVPAGTKIKIVYTNKGNSSSIQFTNDNFSMEIIVGMLSGGAGLPQKSIRNEVWSQRYPRDHQLYSMTHFRYLDAACYLNATFNFPEYDMQGFADYQNYYNSIRFILDRHWNFDLARNKYPAKEILAIDDKLNDVLQRLPMPVKPTTPVMKKELSEKKLHKIGRIDQIVRDYFEANKTVMEIPAKDLMPLFIKKGIFLSDPKNGLYIRNLLRDMDRENKLHLLKHVKVARNQVNRSWYFTR